MSALTQLSQSKALCKRRRHANRFVLVAMTRVFTVLPFCLANLIQFEQSSWAVLGLCSVCFQAQGREMSGRLLGSLPLDRETPRSCPSLA